MESPSAHSDWPLHMAGPWPISPAPVMGAGTQVELWLCLQDDGRSVAEETSLLFPHVCHNYTHVHSGSVLYIIAQSTLRNSSVGIAFRVSPSLFVWTVWRSALISICWTTGVLPDCPLMTLMRAWDSAGSSIWTPFLPDQESTPA